MRISSKLRGGGPILHNGIKAVVSPGIPPPRTVIGNPSRGVRQSQNRQVFLERVSSLLLCGTDDVRSPLKAGRSVLGPDGKVMAHGTTAVLVLGNVK